MEGCEISVEIEGLIVRSENHASIRLWGIIEQRHLVVATCTERMEWWKWRAHLIQRLLLLCWVVQLQRVDLLRLRERSSARSGTRRGSWRGRLAQTRVDS